MCPYKPKQYGAEKRKERRREYDKSRKSEREFYWSERWRKFRRWFLMQPENVCCKDCEREGRSVPAVEVHHEQKRRDNPEAAFDAEACMGLCKRHHSARTARGE